VLFFPSQRATVTRLELTWTKGAGEDDWREALWAARSRSPQQIAENALIQKVTSVVRSVPALFGTITDQWATGSRGYLEGMAAVRFVVELLPELEAIDGVHVEWSVSYPTIEKPVAAPVVNLSGSESAAERLVRPDGFGDGGW